MKKLLLVCFAVGLVLSFGSIAMAGTGPGTGINGTFHDLSSSGSGSAAGDTVDQQNLNRICIYCHAPHNTLPPQATIDTYRPLWNHEASRKTVFTMYKNTITADTPQSGMHQSQAMAWLELNSTKTPGGVSMLCLSCHDGSVATNSYGLSTNSTGIGSVGTGGKFIATRAQIGNNGDLSNHHPIGFPYDQAASNDVEILPVGSPVTGAKANGPANIGDLLWGANATVECVSCHDVHNSKNTGERFLWISDTQSKLCLTCHAKANL